VSPVASAPVESFHVAHAHQGERNARPRTGCLCRSARYCGTTLCPSLKEGVCDDTFLLIYTRAENHTHTHLNHTHI
jgi:hypothetical protein